MQVRQFMVMLIYYILDTPTFVMLIPESFQPPQCVAGLPCASELL